MKDPKPDKEEKIIFQNTIGELGEVFDALEGDDDNREKIKNAAEFIDDLRLIRLGSRECDVGRTIPR